MKVRVRAALAAAAMLAAGPAAAEWRQASSRHFVVYADGNEADIRALAERLERFDALMRLLLHAEADAGPPANRVTVYVVPGNVGALQKLYAGSGRRDDGVAGFYLPRASGSVAFVPQRVGGGDPLQLDQQIVLFHEYAHHAILGNQNVAYPLWYAEGLPEFASTVRFEKDGVVIGAPAQHRAYGLLAGPGISVEAMFSPAGRKLDDAQREAVYGRGWVLTHMVFFDTTRGEQLRRYLTLLNGGTPSLEAAKQAFGNLKALDRAMTSYTMGRFKAIKLPLDRLAAPDVTIRPLTEGEAAMVPLRIVSTRGVDAKLAGPLFARAAPVAARYPKDATVQGWFAEMAYDAGQDAEADAAADRALAAAPDAMQPLLYKGDVALRRAAKAKTDKAGWAAARAWLVRANRAHTAEAAPFVEYYRSFAAADEAPSKSAVAGLYEAMALVPQDIALRLMAARQALVDGKAPEARFALRPIAYNPHAPADNPAMQVLQLLDKEGAPAALALVEKLEKAEEAAGKAAGVRPVARRPADQPSLASSARLRSRP